ncbi:MAG: VTT domain-containing protein, partial [Bdellovibrionaceae bacterium]|nr:VTT domain-containing protein [Pseudobdellovibrionaceae bacterium]
MNRKWILLFLVLAVFATFFYFDASEYLQLDFIKNQQTQLLEFYAKYPLLYIFLFSLAYVLMTSLSIPGATLLTLLAGALFGVTLGSIIVSFASTIGATIAFLGSRWLLRDTIAKRFSKYFSSINKGIEKNGAFYLFTLRLTPAVPFFVVNLVMGLTSMRAVVFYIISQIGMIPATIIYVNAGTQLATIKSLHDIVSAKIIISLIALGIFPLFVKKIMDFFETRSVYKKFKKPKKYDYNLIVIGAGAAGLVTSYIAAAAKAKVALVEKHKMGGDCLNTGCIPSKTFIRTAKLLADAKRSEDLGIKKMTAEFDFADVMERVKRVIKTIEPHDSIERYSNLGVDCHTGAAKIVDPWTVDINGLQLTTKN